MFRHPIFGVHCRLVTDFSIAAMALSASGKMPREFSSASNASTPRGPRRMRNPTQMSPFMTDTRCGASLPSLDMYARLKERPRPAIGEQGQGYSRNDASEDIPYRARTE